MSALTMPMIIVNLGCEMLYVLEQRLKAQAIPADKSFRVLRDVITRMFDKDFLDKLFTPQPMYPVAVVRKMFDKLAHSSIMKLSESSMDKLFDLMMMGFKYQLLCATRLEQMLDVSRMHLTSLGHIMTSVGDTTVQGTLSDVDHRLVLMYANLNMGQAHLLRQSLQKFFQDRRVKVSLFLQEGIQMPNGRLVFSTPAGPDVGTVRVGGGGYRVPMKCQEMDPKEFFQHPVPLGANLYNKERPKVVPPVRKGDAAVPQAAAEEDAAPSKSGPGAYAEEVLEKGGREVRKELDLLGALLSSKPPAGGDNFKLALFGDDDPGYGSAGGSKVINLNFDARRNDAHLAGVMNAMNLGDRGAAGAGDDLLDLMDNAR